MADNKPKSNVVPRQDVPETVFGDTTSSVGVSDKAKKDIREWVFKNINQYGRYKVTNPFNGKFRFVRLDPSAEQTNKLDQTTMAIVRSKPEVRTMNPNEAKEYMGWEASILIPKLWHAYRQHQAALYPATDAEGRTAPDLVGQSTPQKLAEFLDKYVDLNNGDTPKDSPTVTPDALDSEIGL